MRSQQQYSSFAKTIHWILAIFIIGNYILGISLDNTHWYSFHKQVGFSILILVIVRIIGRIIQKYPDQVANLSKFERILSISVHELLYLLMLIVPLSGILMVNAFGHEVTYFGFTIPKIIAPLPKGGVELLATMHFILATAFVSLVGLHVAGALKHYFIDKDTVLSRMLPSFKKST